MKKEQIYDILVTVASIIFGILIIFVPDWVSLEDNTRWVGWLLLFYGVIRAALSIIKQKA